MQGAGLPVERATQCLQPLCVVLVVLVDMAAEDDDVNTVGAGGLESPCRALNVGARRPCVIDQEDVLAGEVLGRALLAGIDRPIGHRRS